MLSHSPALSVCSSALCQDTWREPTALGKQPPSPALAQGGFCHPPAVEKSSAVVVPPPPTLLIFAPRSTLAPCLQMAEDKDTGTAPWPSTARLRCSLQNLEVTLMRWSTKGTGELGSTSGDGSGQGTARGAGGRDTDNNQLLPPVTPDKTVSHHLWQAGSVLPVPSASPRAEQNSLQGASPGCKSVKHRMLLLWSKALLRLITANPQQLLQARAGAGIVMALCHTWMSP